MAYVPDLAIEQSHLLTPTAFRLYCFICRYRNHKYGNAIITPGLVANALDVSQSQIYRALDELRNLEWIVRRGTFVTPIYGDFQPVETNRRQFAPTRKSFAPTQEKFAPVRNHTYSYPAFNQPLEKTDEIIDRAESTWITPCRFCNELGCEKAHIAEIMQEQQNG